LVEVGGLFGGRLPRFVKERWDVARKRLVKFDSENPANELAKMDDAEIDDLAFGAIEIDHSGKILRYNAAEGDISGRDPDEVIGKDFFTEVAPCTDTEDFRGRFQKGTESGHLDVQINYTFDYQMAPTQVRVRMQESPQGDDYWNTYWIFVKRL
jgi:photoactive yellow protein